MEENKVITTKPTQEETIDLATRLLSSFTANLPLVYEPINFLLASGALFSSQSIVKMGEEIQSFIKSSKAKKESDNKLSYRKLYETIKFLHNSDSIDDEFLEAVRNLHILTFADEFSHNEILEVYACIETLRKLSGTEISVLLACYRIKNKMYYTDKLKELFDTTDTLTPVWANQWARMIGKATGITQSDYIESLQNHLETLRLITPRNHNVHALDGKGNDLYNNNGSRLTDFGYRLCELIVRGEELFQGNK